MNHKLIIIATLFVIGVATAISASPLSEKVERLLEGEIIQDNFMDEDDSLPDVPLRRRDSLARFTPFILRNGCTTNEFVEALKLAATNGSYSLEWTEDQKDTIAARALVSLKEIDCPDVTNFVRIVNADGKQNFRYVDFSASFIHTNLEPEILCLTCWKLFPRCRRRCSRRRPTAWRNICTLQLDILRMISHGRMKS